MCENETLDGQQYDVYTCRNLQVYNVQITFPR